MQKYCPNNSNFTFREICCAPLKHNEHCDDMPKKDNCNCNKNIIDNFDCRFPPLWCYPDGNCPHSKHPFQCGNKCCENPCTHSNNCCKCPCHDDNERGNKPICKPHQRPYNHCVFLPICQQPCCIDPRFLLWTALYPCFFPTSMWDE